MATITNYFEQAQLSLAAYALDLQSGMMGEAYPQYVPKLISAGMSEAQAKSFANTYKVVDQYTNTLTGFSATVFDKSGEKFVAIRGTENLFSFSGAIDWLTNVNGVGSDGIAIAQGLELFNYLQRLYGLAGNPVVQYGYDDTLRAIYTTTGTANGLLSGQTVPMSVTGHSLGGHLAMMMSRMVPGVVDSVYTFNAPGFDTPLGRLSQPLTSSGFFNALQNASIGPITGAIGTSWNPGIMTHLDVPGDIVSEIGTTPGVSNIIFSESANQGVIDAHSIKPITDSLAVYNLLATLDSNLNTASNGLSTITDILEAASHKPEQSLEAIVNALGDLFQAGADITLIDNRDKLYERLIAIQQTILDTSGNLKPEYQNLRIADTTSLAGAAHANTPDGYAYRYALVNLNPFAVSGDTALYATHNANGELDLYDLSTGLGQLTDPYLKDRAYMLTRLIEGNVDDKAYVSILGGQSEYFYDFATMTDVATANFSGTFSADPLVYHPELRSNAAAYLFGNDAGNTFEGGDLADHLYGGGGNDTIRGGGGADYIEGNDGNDTINAGDGDNKVLGGAGDDVVTAGQGADILIGGAGVDALSAGEGNDTIYGGDDSDLLYGDAGNDFLNGGAGMDILSGGADNDFVYDPGGGSEVNTLKGDAGKETILGGAGADNIDGGLNNDEIYDDDGKDILYGGAGVETRGSLMLRRAA